MAPFYNILKNIICITIVILLCISFLNYNHYYPWTSFDSEKYIVYSCVLVYLKFFLLNKNYLKIEGNIFLLIILFFTSIFSFKYYSFNQYFYLFNLYLVNLIVFSIILINIDFEKFKILEIVIIAIFISGCISSVLCIFQWLDYASNSFWLYKSTGYRFSANLAQPNHLSTLLILALLSSLYFFNKLKFFPIVFFVSLLLFALQLTQSRSALIALFLIIILTFVKWGVTNIKAKVILFSFLPIYLLFGKLLSITNEKINTVERMGGSFERIAIWQDFFHVIPHISFWGVGWKNIEYFQFEFGINSYGYLSSYHNLFLDLIVLFGVFGVVFFIYIFLNLFKIFIKINQQSDYIVFLMIVVLINHSLLEFPLFYSYFLFIFLVFYFSMTKKYLIKNINLILNGRFFLIFVLLIIMLNLFYVYSFEKNSTNYRALFLGYCVSGISKNFIFDEFDNLSIINCKENLTLNNIEVFEKALLLRPSSNNILKMINIYNNLGEFEKRDKLLAKYNVRFNRQYTLNDIINK